MKYLKSFASGSFCLRWMFLLLGVVLFIEVLLFNCIILYIYSQVSSELASLTETSGSPFSKLLANKKINSLLFNAKTDGVFTSLLQETIERMYIIHQRKPGDDILPKDKSRLPDISFFGLDVSHSREATYIYQRILSRETFPYAFLVVDIGANDGFLSSNSFNFIQWGWDAVLVDPQPTEIKAAKKNLREYIDKYSEGSQQVNFEQSAIANHDGHIKFAFTRESTGMESHVVSRSKETKKEDLVMSVPSISVKTLAKRYSIPKNFGILSLDAEGMGAEIVHWWMELGFKPGYIIFERLHQQEPLSDTVRYLETFGYSYIGTRGWNIIFEHDPK